MLAVENLRVNYGSFTALDIAKPTFAAFVLLILFIYLLAVALLILSHAIVTCMKRFGPTYGVTMALYFAFMTFGGRMGVSADSLPTGMRYICKALPMYGRRDI